MSILARLLQLSIAVGLMSAAVLAPTIASAQPDAGTDVSACAAGVSDNASALTPNNSSIFRKLAPLERNANMFITLQYFLDDNCGRIPTLAADLLQAWREQRRNAAGGSSGN